MGWSGGWCQTGYTEEGGMGLVGSALRQGRRLLLVINGLPSKKARANEARRLLEWGFRNFTIHRLFKAASVVKKVKILGGTQPFVSLVSLQDIALTLQPEAVPHVQIQTQCQGPLTAPVTQGQALGTFQVKVPNPDGSLQTKTFHLHA